ncbi:MAG: hypothetical protein AB2814_08815 [Candidatus Sedimenticola endophacoides]
MATNPQLLERAEQLIERLEQLITPRQTPPDWGHIAYRWRPQRGLEPVRHPHRIALDDLLCMERQKTQECRYLVKDFGTSQSPKSTRQRGC